MLLQPQTRSQFAMISRLICCTGPPQVGALRMCCLLACRTVNCSAFPAVRLIASMTPTSLPMPSDFLALDLTAAVAAASAAHASTSVAAKLAVFGTWALSRFRRPKS